MLTKEQEIEAVKFFNEHTKLVEEFFKKNEQKTIVEIMVLIHFLPYYVSTKGYGKDYFSKLIDIMREDFDKYIEIIEKEESNDNHTHTQ